MTMITKMIWVTFQREGIHKYPGADQDPNLATGDEYDVSWLAYPHRHTFHFQVWLQVWHDDREVEIIQFKRWLQNLFGEGTLQLDYKSVEMVAEDLYQQINKKYPGRIVYISVAEDGENGCLMKYE